MVSAESAHDREEVTALSTGDLHRFEERFCKVFSNMLADHHHSLECRLEDLRTQLNQRERLVVAPRARNPRGRASMFAGTPSSCPPCPPSPALSAAGNETDGAWGQKSVVLVAFQYTVCWLEGAPSPSIMRVAPVSEV